MFQLVLDGMCACVLQRGRQQGLVLQQQSAARGTDQRTGQRTLGARPRPIDRRDERRRNPPDGADRGAHARTERSQTGCARLGKWFVAPRIFKTFMDRNSFLFVLL